MNDLKAWILQEVGKIEYTEVDIPKVSKKDVLVKVMASGICGSDIQRIYENGAHKMPLIIGHEFSGQVVKVGDPSNDSYIGKRVGIFPLIPCKTCDSCKVGKYELCSNYSYLGSRQDGGFADYVSVPLWNVIKLPSEVSYEEGAMLEPLAVAVHAIRRISSIENQKVVVYGLGTIGLLLSMILIDRGVEEIFVIGNKEFQKQKAISIGIKESHYCDIREHDAIQYILSITQGQGADVVFECIGRNETISNAIEMASPEGKICFVGNPYTDVVLSKNTYWKILRKQLWISGTWNSSFKGSGVENLASDNLDDWQYALNLLKENRIQPTVLITHRLSFSALDQGFCIMKEKKVDYIKIMKCEEGNYNF